MRLSIFSTLLFFAGNSFAQRTVDVTKQDVNFQNSSFFYVVNGSPVSLVKYVKVVDGSPFFGDDWMKARIILSLGKEYDNLLVKLDLLANELYYKDASGHEMVATSTLQQVVLIDTVKSLFYTFVYSDAIPFAGNPPDKGWYQVMTNGKAILYKQFVKTINEVKPYGSATVEQTIYTTSNFFVLYNDRFTHIKKFKDLTDLLADKKTLLQQYITAGKLNGKKEDDYISVVTYYNDLFQ
jgi:hypothetical protein